MYVTTSAELYASAETACDMGGWGTATGTCDADAKIERREWANATTINICARARPGLEDERRLRCDAVETRNEKWARMAM